MRLPGRGPGKSPQEKLPDSPSKLPFRKQSELIAAFEATLEPAPAEAEPVPDPGGPSGAAGPTSDAQVDPAVALEAELDSLIGEIDVEADQLQGAVVQFEKLEMVANPPLQRRMLLHTSDRLKKVGDAARKPAGQKGRPGQLRSRVGLERPRGGMSALRVPSHRHPTHPDGGNKSGV